MVLRELDRYFAEIGGLIAYGIDNIDMYRRAAAYADRVHVIGDGRILDIEGNEGSYVVTAPRFFAR